MSHSLSHLFDDRRVIVCAGSGGVGKTTVAAALALAATDRKRRVLCLTIDPARRLANSLGLDAITEHRQRVSPELLTRAGLAAEGELTVMMLDTKSTFDALIERHASSAEARDRMLNNSLYRHISTNLAGTQSYMAMEKLLEVQRDPQYDLIVLDTPPTTDALDFLEAPKRLVDALDSAALRWFLQAFSSSRRFSLKLVQRSVAVVLKNIGKLTGGGFLEQTAEFVTDLNELFGGFRERATRVAEAFRSPDFGYVLVTTPSPVAIREAIFFGEHLQAQEMSADAYVVNRLNRAPSRLPSVDEIAAAVKELDLPLGEGTAERLRGSLDAEHQRAETDEEHLKQLERALENPQSGPTPIRINVPALPSDVHDVTTLAGIARLLCPTPAS